MFRRVLLVAPPSSSYLGAIRLPSNLGYLAESLLRAGIDYAVEDMRDASSFAALQRRVRAIAPDLIAVSLFSLGYRHTYDLIREVKRSCPRAAVVVGGPHVSALEGRVLEECPEIDFAVVQEGEKTLVQLCRGEVPFAEMGGLFFREDGIVRSGPKPEPIEELDRIPYPTYAHFVLKRYAKEIPLVTSRGCPYRCIFCFHSIMQDAFRARSAASVVDEMEHWYAQGIRQFVVDDDNFTLVKKRVYQICDEIERRGLKDLFIRCANGIRADRVDHDLLRRLKSVGVHEVGFGADGGNDRVLLEVVQKGESLETIEAALREAIDVGLGVRLFIILGHPGETMSDVEDSFALAQRYPLIRLHLNNPIPYPGTKLFDWVQEHKRFLRPPEEYLNSLTDSDTEPVFDTPELPAEARRELMVRAREIERKVWREATERMLDRQPAPVRRLAAQLFATEFGRWLFFKNLSTRSIINRFWYHRVTRE